MSDPHYTMNCPWCNAFMATHHFPTHLHTCPKNPHIRLLTLLVLHWMRHHPNIPLTLQTDFLCNIPDLLAQVIADPDVAHALAYHWYSDEVPYPPSDS